MDPADREWSTPADVATPGITPADFSPAYCDKFEFAVIAYGQSVGGFARLQKSFFIFGSWEAPTFIDNGFPKSVSSYASAINFIPSKDATSVTGTGDLLVVFVQPDGGDVSTMYIHLFD
jgi:hypothetical protein